MKNFTYLKPYFLKHKKKLMWTTFLMFIISAIAMLPAQITSMIIDLGFGGKKYSVVLIFSFLLLALYIIKTFLTYYTSNNFIVAGSDVLSDFRSNMYEKILYFGLDFFSKEDSGYITARINESSSIANLFSNQTFGILISIVEFLFSLIIILIMNYKLALLMCIPLPIILLVILRTSANFKALIEQNFESGAEYSGKINEVVTGIENIKGSNTEKEEAKKLKKYNDSMIEKSKKQAKSLVLTTQTISFLNYFISILVYIIAGIFVVNGSISLGMFFSFSSYIGKLYSPIFAITTVMLTVQPSLSALNRTIDFMENVENVSSNNGNEKIDIISSIQFNNVGMSFGGSKVFSNVNFTIEAGDKCLLIGHNGSGKSTLIKLIMKLYNPTEGQILLNNINSIDVKTETLINSIAYVPQKIFLFNDTIKNNLIYGLKDCSIEKYNEVIKLLKLDDWISSLPNGDNTMVGSNAFSLSGGQIQKIAIGRALLKEANFYIFDEFISQVDQEVSQILEDVLNHFPENTTVILVDHKNNFSSIVNKIIDLDQY